MKTEYEVMFLGISPEDISKKLITCGAKKTQDKQLYKRMLYKIPGIDFGTFIRVRDEGKEISFTIKSLGENHGSDSFAKELETTVSDYGILCKMLDIMGMKKVRYEENYRTKWLLEGVEICLDERPGVSPYIEIEGSNIEGVQRVSHLLGFDYNKGMLGNLFSVAEKELGYSWIEFNARKEITFENPLVYQCPS